MPAQLILEGSGRIGLALGVARAKGWRRHHRLRNEVSGRVDAVHLGYVTLVVRYQGMLVEELVGFVSHSRARIDCML